MCGKKGPASLAVDSIGFSVAAPGSCYRNIFAHFPSFSIGLPRPVSVSVSPVQMFWIFRNLAVHRLLMLRLSYLFLTTRMGLSPYSEKAAGFPL